MTSSVNVSTVVVANTFDQWRIQTNLLKDDVNEIARGDFVKPAGNVTISVGRVVISNATGTTLDVTANARIGGLLDVKDLNQGSNGFLYSDSGDVKFSNGAGTIHANGNTRTRFLYNNNFISAANINATGFIETTGSAANANLIMNVGGVVEVRSAANSANVYVNGNLIVSGLATMACANITNLEVNSLTVSQPISAPSESDSSSYRLRVSQTTRGIGTFGVFQGTSNGNAAIRFNTTGNVWQSTANDLTTWSNLLTTANILSTYTTDSANTGSLTIIKGANDNALAAYAAANAAVSSVRVSANTGSTIAANGINFNNSATLLVSVTSGITGNANIAFEVIGGVGGTQGATGIQGATGTRGYAGGTVHEFTTGQTSDTDPGNGKFAFNNATVGSVTFIYIDQVDYLGTDRSNHYLSFDDANSGTNRGTLVLGSSGSGTDGVTFRVTGTVTAGAGYYKIPVAWISGALPTNGAIMSMMFAPAGAQGTTGTQGATGTQGTTGAGIQGAAGTAASQGATGTQGATGATGAGTQGTTGSQGIQGRQGTTGLQGTTGAGTQGTTGTSGSNGSQGATGSGTQGSTGAQGTSGAALSGGNNTYLAKWSSGSTLGYGTAYESGGTVYSTDFSASSDGRLKNVIGNLSGMMNAVEQIRGVRYEWNQTALDMGYNNERAPELGVIAQEVQSVMPEAVSMDDKGYLSVSYDRLIPVLIEAVKELNARIKTLERK